jgi:myo-inositol 2-dehydrogenase/D-chiro-inositol 1-dehydrogenase
MPQLNVGILGAGKMGKVYARWFDAHPQCRVAAIYNRTSSRAAELAAAYPGAGTFARWEALVADPHIDVVGVCTPSHEHLEQVRAALAAGKHVLCEKPMANDVNQCREMVALSRAARSTMMVGFQMRFHPVVAAVDRLLPRIGPIYHIDFNFSLYRPGVNWRHHLLQGGGVLKELSSHLFDLMERWAGPIAAVAGQNRIIQPGREVEDYCSNQLEFAGGATGFLFSSYHDRRSSCIHGNLMGWAGQIAFQFSSYDPADSRVTLYTDAAESIPVPIPDEIDAVYPGHLDSFQREIAHFVDCILHDRRPAVTAEDGCRALEIIDASYESTRRGGRPVRLPLEDFDTVHLAACFRPFTVKGHPSC